MKSSDDGALARRWWAVGALLAIITAQAFASLTLQNTAMIDEGLYLWYGHQQLDAWAGGPPFLNPYANQMSGMLYLYPVLAAALDRVGGLEFVRGFSLLCMLGATVGVAWCASRLFGVAAGVVAAALFAVQAPVLYLGRQAVYDALCLLLVVVALLIAVRSDTVRSPWPTALAVGAVLTLASGVKYVGLLFVPTVLGVLGLRLLPILGWRRALGAMAAGASVLITATAILLITYPAALGGVFGHTLGREALAPSERLGLATYAWSVAGVLLVFAAVSPLVIGRAAAPVMALFLGSALLPPAYHVAIGESVSLHKHVAYTALFLSPLAGLTLTRALRLGEGRTRLDAARWGVVAALTLALFSAAYGQARWLFEGWANTDALIATLRPHVQTGADRYLADELDIVAYSLRDQVRNHWQWSTFYGFTNTRGQYVSGESDFRQAVLDGWFAVIVFSSSPAGERLPTVTTVASALRSGAAPYDRVATLPYRANWSPPGSRFEVWVRRPSATPAVALP